MARGLSKDFLNAMREKLEHGRWRGYEGWDQRWAGYSMEPHCGTNGFLMRRLFDEYVELVLAVASGNPDVIRSEAADVANFAMMVADIHGALDSPKDSC